MHVSLLCYAAWWDACCYSLLEFAVVGDGLCACVALPTHATSFRRVTFHCAAFASRFPALAGRAERALPVCLLGAILSSMLLLAVVFILEGVGHGPNTSVLMVSHKKKWWLEGGVRKVGISNAHG